MKYLKKFETQSAYEAAQSGLILPNVSLTVDNNTVHYNPYVEPETRVVAKYNVTDTSSPTKIGYYEHISGFSSIEIDGVEQPLVVSAYTFTTTGEHTVKYTLTDPTKIGPYSLESCKNLTDVTIPDSVTSVQQYAFYNCENLTGVTIPNSVTEIQGSFQWCSNLTNITIPDSVTIIGDNSFNGCNFTNVVIPSGVTFIGQAAFKNCSNLTNVTVNRTTPPTLLKRAFDDNASGRKIYVPSESVSVYISASGWSNYAGAITSIP